MPSAAISKRNKEDQENSIFSPSSIFPSSLFTNPVLGCSPLGSCFPSVLLSFLLLLIVLVLLFFPGLEHSGKGQPSADKLLPTDKAFRRQGYSH